jgi:ATP-binding cassette, subfamily C, bacterial CydC
VAAASGRHQAAARAQMTGALVEAIDGSAELALAGRGQEHVRKLAASDARLAELGRSDALASSLASAIQSLLTGAGLIAVLVVAIHGVRSGALAGVLVAAVAFLFLGAREAVMPLPAAARRLQTCAAAASRLEDICAREPNIVDPARPQHPSGNGALAVQEVTLAYEPESGAVLEGVSLRLEPGEHVALTGVSGAGKTTLAELLVRFLDPERGCVTLDGIDVRRLAQEDLRRAVLLCDQDAYLFNTTIRENLLIGRREADERDLWSVLEAVGLDEWVSTLEHSLDTRVGQQGELVSGGQGRRLALARALLSDARFLILDEPTAHLDAPLARRVMEGMLEHARSRGVLVITHDLDAIDAFDRVLVLDRGRLSPMADAA